MKKYVTRFKVAEGKLFKRSLSKGGWYVFPLKKLMTFSPICMKDS